MPEIFANSLQTAAIYAYYSSFVAVLSFLTRVFHAVQSIGARQSEE